jgi:hypothetical protein
MADVAHVFGTAPTSVLQVRLLSVLGYFSHRKYFEKAKSDYM